MPDIHRKLKAWPKIDLHRHLEGSVRLDTLADIAREHGSELPGPDVETIRPYVQITNEPRNVDNFLAKFSVLRRFYKTSDVIERVAREAVADAAADNVRYLELRFTPSALASACDFDLEDVVGWVIQAVRKAERDFNIRVSLLMSLLRHEDLSIGQRIAELAIENRRDIVGLDLAGDEVAFSARPFSDLFLHARDAGLGITIHAGEWNGFENVIESIEHLHADRIGHGVRVIENSHAIRFIKQRNVTLEICPTSNLQSGVFRDAGQHPLGDLLGLGLNITINTDDPSVSNITLTDEYALAVNQLGLSATGLKQAILNAAQAAFLPPKERAALLAWFEQALVDYSI